MTDRFDTFVFNLRLRARLLWARVRPRLETRLVSIAVVGLCALAAVQVLTGTAVLGHSTQEAAKNVLQLLLVLGLARTVHEDITHEGRSHV